MKYSILFSALSLATTQIWASPVHIRDTALTDADILNFALTLEHLENAFYTQGLASYDAGAFEDDSFPDWVRGRITQIGQHESTHVSFLTTALTAAGATPVSACTYSFPDTDPASFVALSEVLETVGTSAYNGAAQFVQNKDYLTAAAAILAVEGRHAAWINSAALKLNPWNTAFETPLDLNQVYTLASQFITSCPSSNPSLPVSAFPALTVENAATARPGQTVTLDFTPASSESGTQLYAAFLSGLSAEFAPINSDNVVTIPGDLLGTVFVIVTSDNTSTSDNVTIAGPAVLQFSFDSSGNIVA